MIPQKKAAEAASTESAPEVAQGMASVEQLAELKTEVRDGFDQLKEQMGKVTSRVEELESVMDPRSQPSVQWRLPGTEEVNQRVSTPGGTTVITGKAVTFEDTTPVSRQDNISCVTPGNSVILEDEEGVFENPMRKGLKPLPNVQRRSANRDSTMSSQSDMSGSPSDCDYGTLQHTTSPGIIRGESVLKRRSMRPASSVCTVWGQAAIAAKIPVPIRILGTALGFITVVLLWETTDGIFRKAFPLHDIRLIAYLGLSTLSAVLLALSDHWIRKSSENDSGSLIPSFAYSLSTLFLAIGSWGTFVMAIKVLVPPKMELFFHASAGVIALFCTVGYAFQTKHNVLLDIASCATTLGLNEKWNNDADDDDDDDFIQRHSASQPVRHYGIHLTP